MLQEEEKTGPQTSTKEADMPDSKIDGLDYGVPSDQVCRVLQIVRYCISVRT